MAEQYLDFSKLDDWLRSDPKRTLATLAVTLADAIAKSAYRRQGRTASAANVLKRLKQWKYEKFPSVGDMYQDGLKVATDRAATVWFSSTNPTLTPTVAHLPAGVMSEPKPEDAKISNDVVDYDKILPKTYPPNFKHEDDLSRARNLLLTGLCMRRTGVISEHDFEEQKTFSKLVHRIVLDAGGIVKLIMLHPNARACRFGWMQDYWTDKGEPKMSYETYCCEVKQALHSFYEIQASVRKQLGDNRTDERDFIVYPIDYMLTSGLDIMDFGPSDSVAYVRFYPLASRQVGEDCPILRLEKKYHPQWFQFYKEQFALHESLANEQVAQGLFSHSLDQKEAPLDRSSRPSRSRSRRGRRSAKKRAAKSRH